MAAPISLSVSSVGNTGFGLVGSTDWKLNVYKENLALEPKDILVSHNGYQLDEMRERHPGRFVLVIREDPGGDDFKEAYHTNEMDLGLITVVKGGDATEIKSVISTALTRLKNAHNLTYGMRDLSYHVKRGKQTTTDHMVKMLTSSSLLAPFVVRNIQYTGGDYTELELYDAFGASGTPVGINHPEYPIDAILVVTTYNPTPAATTTPTRLTITLYTLTGVGDVAAYSDIMSRNDPYLGVLPAGANAGANATHVAEAVHVVINRINQLQKYAPHLLTTAHGTVKDAVKKVAESGAGLGIDETRIEQMLKG